MNVLMRLTRTGNFATGQQYLAGRDYEIGTLQGDFAEGIRGAYLAVEEEEDE